MLTAVVIPFPKRAAKSSPASQDLDGPAQIILFPGVRYDRMPETEDLFVIATSPLKSPSKGK